MYWKVNADSKRFTELQKYGRGSLHYLTDTNSRIAIVSWINNDIVQAISSFTDPKFGDNISQSLIC